MPSTGLLQLQFWGESDSRYYICFQDKIETDVPKNTSVFLFKTMIEDKLLPCVYKQMLGIDCPLCGFQRSLLLLFKGEVTSSFHMYPPLIPILSLIALLPFYIVNTRVSYKKVLYGHSISVLTIISLSYIVKIIN